MKKQKRSGERLALHVSAVSIVWNVVLSAFKLFAGIFARSGAMVSDAVHSASDVLSTVIVIVGVRLANQAPDREHPFGHERMECVAAVVLAMILAVTGVGIGWAGVEKIASGGRSLEAPGVLALVAATVSIAVKEGMYWYTRSAAKRIPSSALMADAWHHRSDALSSVGSFAGILGARLGVPVLDPLASVAICLFILKAACSIFREAVGKMTDRACDGAIEGELRAAAEEQEGVLGVDQLKIRADGKESLNEAHAAAQRVHDVIEARFPAVKHCMVHVNPAEGEETPE